MFGISKNAIRKIFKSSEHRQFIKENRKWYEERFSEFAVSTILSKPLMTLMIGFMASIAAKYSLSTHSPIFAVVLLPLAFTAFFHQTFAKFIKPSKRYLVLHIHVGVYIALNIFNQLFLLEFDHGIVPKEQFVMIYLLVVILASFIATSPYFFRTLVLNLLLLLPFTASMIVAGDHRGVEMVRHSVQSIALGLAISYVMMLNYRYRVFMKFQEKSLIDRADTILQKSQQIEKVSAEIQTMQSSMPSSILKIESNGVISYASKTEEILGCTDLVGQNCKNLIASIREDEKITADSKDQFWQAVQGSLGEDEINFEVNKDKFLAEFAYSDRHLAANYGYHLDKNGAVEYLLVILSDNSSKIANERNSKEQAVILSLVEHLARIPDFIADATRFCAISEKILKQGEHGEALKRTLHTFKGLSRSMGLTDLSAKIHNAETLALVDGDQAKLAKEIGEIKNMVASIRNIAESKMQIDLSRQKVVLSCTEEEVIDAYKQDRLDSIVLRASCRDISSIFSFYKPALEKQAASQNKGNPYIVVNSPELFVTKATSTALSGAVGHILRNAVDHGIESLDERSKASKPQNGSIFVNITVVSDKISIRIKDDGRGLNLSKIRQKALEKGLIEDGVFLSRTEIANLIFSPSFSTRDEVSETSGRGVGMDAVKAEIDDLGGTVSIEVGEGDAYVSWTLCIDLPSSLAINV